MVRKPHHLTCEDCGLEQDFKYVMYAKQEGEYHADLTGHTVEIDTIEGGVVSERTVIGNGR